MEIVETLAGEACGNGISCDRIASTDGADVVVQGRRLTAEQAAGLGLTVPPGEGLLLIDRRLVEQLRTG